MKANRFLTVSLLLIFSVLTGLACMATAVADEELVNTGIPKGKQTTLGLYVTAEEAYEKWLAAPESVKVLDVRTLEEYIFVGHATMARNIPLYYQTHEWDAGKGRFVMQPNPDFLSQVTQVADPEETIMVMCRSGGRGARAVDMLAEAGFKHVYNITDGMEGDSIDDPGSVFQGQRLRNGWKNSGLPWSYKIDPERLPLTGSQETDSVTPQEQAE
jgi:rhodanese-related sulfurtransferase